jgi:hypothetical protein
MLAEPPFLPPSPRRAASVALSADPMKEIGSEGLACHFGEGSSLGLGALPRRHPNEELIQATAEDAIGRQSDFADHHRSPPLFLS